MKKRAVRKSFADLVRDVVSAPAAVTSVRDDLPGFSGDGFLDRDGRRYLVEQTDVSERRALEAASAGAQVVWDRCGCGGYCGLEWSAPDEVRQMVKSGAPTISRKKRRTGRISEWRSSDGATLLLAEDAVRWGEFLS